MFFINKWPRLTVLIIGLVGLLLLRAFWSGTPALAQIDDYSLVRIQFPWDTVEVKDSDGNPVGSGNFRATVSSSRNGRTQGRAVLEMPDFTVEIDFTAVDEILYQDGNPVGVVLSGRGTLISEGKTETFPATATVGDGATTTIPDCLIWDIPGAPVVGGLIFEAEGTLSVRE